MLGRYKLDDLDWYGTYGFAINRGADGFLKLPERKPTFSYDWPEENGVDIDLSTPAYKEREIALEGILMADDEADFWLKFDAMRLVLTQSGLRSIYVTEFEKEFSVYYNNCTSLERLTRVKTPAGVKVACKMTLNFIEPIPDGVDPGTHGGYVQILNQDEDLVALVQAPGNYHVIEFSGIVDDGSGTYSNSIIDNT